MALPPPPQRDDDKQRVQQAVDIVGLIGEHLALKPAGKEFKGLCPFHDDRNPSMSVSPQKQIYKCFVCGAGGDVFSFVMGYHKLDFVEALKYLAQRAGIELTPWRPQGTAGGIAGGEQGTDGVGKPKGLTQRQRLEAANVQAMAFYQGLLKHPTHGKAARDYIEKRGISDPMVQAFKLGAAPDKWDGLASTIAHKHWSREDFELAGLTSPRKAGGGDYDRLRHRLIFPICDALGRPIAFGGRRLREEDNPKYLNSPETSLFNKSATLYGLDQAKKPIIDAKTAVIVEGYTDVIACHQAGVTNVVATLGTAFTAAHADQLRRFAQRVILLFDPDQAGQKAADRAIEVLFTGDIDPAIAMLPSGLDPADLFEKQDGRELWDAAIQNAKDALSYQLDRLNAQIQDNRSITGRQKLIERFIDNLTQCGFENLSMARRRLIVRQTSQLLSIPEVEVNDRLVRAVRAKKVRKASRLPSEFEKGWTGPNLDADPVAATFVSKAERFAQLIVVGAIMNQPDLYYKKHIDEELAPEEMTGAAGQVYRMLRKRFEADREVELKVIIADLAELGFTDLVEFVTEADTWVEVIATSSTSSMEGLLQDHVDALRFIRDERDYFQKKVAFFHELQLDELGPQRIEAFLRYVADFHQRCPKSTRIMRHETMSKQQEDHEAQAMGQALAG